MQLLLMMMMVKKMKYKKSNQFSTFQRGREGTVIKEDEDGDGQTSKEAAREDSHLEGCTT